MKTIIFFGFLCIIYSSAANSEYEFLKINSNWAVLKNIDEFTDKKSCSLGPINDEVALLFINNANDNDVKEIRAQFGAKSQINSIGIRYRVDNNEPVFLGQEDYNYLKYANVYIVYGKHYEKLINDFKKGREVVYQFMSKGEPANDEVYRVNLMGFTEGYKYKASCNSD